MRRRSEGKKTTDALSPPPAPPTPRRTSRRRKSNLSDDENVVLADLRSEKSGSSTKNDKKENVLHYEHEMEQEEVYEGRRRRSHRNRTPVAEHYGNSSKRSSRSRSNRIYSPDTRSMQSIQEEESDNTESADLSGNDRNHENDNMSKKQLRKMMIEQLQEQNNITKQKEEGEEKEKDKSNKNATMTDSPSIEEETDSEKESTAKEKDLNCTPCMDSDNEIKIKEVSSEHEEVEPTKEDKIKFSSDTERNDSSYHSNKFAKFSSPKEESVDREEADDKDEDSKESSNDQERETTEKFDLQSENQSETSNDNTVKTEELPEKSPQLIDNNVMEQDEVESKMSHEKEEQKKKQGVKKVVANPHRESSVSNNQDEYPEDFSKEHEVKAINERRLKKSNSTKSDDGIQETEEGRVLKKPRTNKRHCSNAAEEEEVLAEEVCFKKTEVKIDKDPKPIDCSNAAALDTGRLRKRRWMTKKAAECGESVLAISTDSLKTLIADVHPVPLSDVQLESSSEPEDVVNSDREEGEKSPSSELEPNNWESSDKLEKGAHSSILKHQQKAQILNEKNTTNSTNASLMGPGTTPGLGVIVTVTTGTTASSSQIATSAVPHRSIGTISNIVTRSPSPARHQASSVLYITNLVRPFTLLQLKGLLARTGKIVEDGFWIDRIKSKCYVQYETEDEAIETRHALHGVRWPVSNPKCLNVDFGERADMLKVIEATKEDNYKYGQDNNKDNIVVGSGWSGERGAETRKTFRPIREWDMGKKENLERDKNLKDIEKHSRDLHEKMGHEYENDVKSKDIQSHDRHSRSGGSGGLGSGNGISVSGRRRVRDLKSTSASPSRKQQKNEEPPLRLLDDLFRKTKVTPYIYWLPLTPEQITEKEILRQKRLEEQKIRLKQREMEREKERNRQHIRERERSHRRNRSSDRRRSRSRDRRRY